MVFAFYIWMACAHKTWGRVQGEDLFQKLSPGETLYGSLSELLDDIDTVTANLM